MTQFQLGSISTGTLRPQDLLNAFGSTLNHLTLGVEKHPFIEQASVAEQNIWDFDDDDAHEHATDLIEKLTDALQELCPPFIYFGTHPGDGADFGFWPDIDRLNEELQWERDHYPDDSVPDELTLDDDGVIVQVSDHGNVTVMDMERNVIWSAV